MIFELFLVWIAVYTGSSTAQSLVVNIANKGGDVFQETFLANTTDDILKLSFQQLDGTLVKHWIDFKAAVQIFRITILPFREFRQTGNQVLCFVLAVEAGNFISTDAMSKLRQKNPHTVRRPEEEKSSLNFTMDYSITPASLATLPRSVRDLCSSKNTLTFAQLSDLTILNLSPSAITASTNSALPPCDTAESWEQSCRCSYPLCIVWYPCDLKYCKSGTEGDDTTEYRCGIKTCKQCRIFDFQVEKKLNCIFDLMS